MFQAKNLYSRVLQVSDNKPLLLGLQVSGNKPLLLVSGNKPLLQGTPGFR